MTAGHSFAWSARKRLDRAPLLADFHFKVPSSPVPPDENSREPEPIGCGIYGRTPANELRGPFYAAWPVEATDGGNEKVEKLVVWNQGENQLVARSGPVEGRWVVRRHRRHTRRQQREHQLRRGIRKPILAMAA